VSKWVSEWVSEWVLEWLSDWVSEWVSLGAYNKKKRKEGKKSIITGVVIHVSLTWTRPYSLSLPSPSLLLHKNSLSLPPPLLLWRTPTCNLWTIQYGNPYQLLPYTNPRERGNHLSTSHYQYFPGLNPTRLISSLAGEVPFQIPLSWEQRGREGKGKKKVKRRKKRGSKKKKAEPGVCIFSRNLPVIFLPIVLGWVRG